VRFDAGAVAVFAVVAPTFGACPEVNSDWPTEDSSDVDEDAPEPADVVLDEARPEPMDDRPLMGPMITPLCVTNL
jgi:hypothetical protein